MYEGVRVFRGRFFARGPEAAQLTSQVVHASEVDFLDSLESVDDVWRSLSHSISRRHGDCDATIFKKVGLALEELHEHLR